MSNNNSTRIKQVFFIDSAVPDSDVIVAGLATDAVYYRLDAILAFLKTQEKSHDYTY
jgi:hypothetical protein